MVEGSIHFFTQRNVTFIHKNAPEKTQETASKKAPHAQRFSHSIPVPLPLHPAAEWIFLRLTRPLPWQHRDRGFQRFLYRFLLQAGCEEMAGNGIASRSAP